MIRRWLMSGFGTGYAPWASGTFGSAAAIVIASGVWFTIDAAGLPPWVRDAIWVVLAILAYVGCIQWGTWAVDYYAGRSRKPGDPGQVVLDEWAGQWIALIALPMATFERTLAVLAVQFFLFRLFDVIKPPPGRYVEKLPAGWGIASDDVIAGVYANIVGQILFRVCFPG